VGKGVRKPGYAYQNPTGNATGFSKTGEQKTEFFWEISFIRQPLAMKGPPAPPPGKRGLLWGGAYGIAEVLGSIRNFTRFLPFTRKIPARIGADFPRSAPADPKMRDPASRKKTRPPAGAGNRQERFPKWDWETVSPEKTRRLSERTTFRQQIGYFGHFNLKGGCFP
jgi:hypothetical protein